MDFENNNIPDYIDSINKLINTSANQQELKILQYTAGLKALLDVLPDDTDSFSHATIESYLWVIELLLQTIYDNLQSRADKEV